jgi:hypothetical protein
LVTRKKGSALLRGTIFAGWEEAEPAGDRLGVMRRRMACPHELHFSLQELLGSSFVTLPYQWRFVEEVEALVTYLLLAL